MARHIDTADQAKMIRAALKRAFPGQKFSVRISRYAGGSSIDVSWTDGPIAKDVEAITRLYNGGGFDGMIDMAYSNEHWLLPNGEVVFASTQGSACSGGMVDAKETLKPAMDAERIRFGGSYVFTQRETSEAFRETLQAAYAAATPATRQEMMGEATRAARNARSWSYANATLEADFGFEAKDVWYAMARATSQAALAAFQIPSLEKIAA